MAARKRDWHPQKTRDKIKATLLVQRLNKIALGEIDVSPAQVTAIKIALGKVLPDLTESSLHHHEEPKSYSENRVEMVNLYGEAKTKILMMEPLEWDDVREIEAYLTKEKARLSVDSKPKLAAG